MENRLQILEDPFILALQSGDKAAYAKLYDQYAGAVYGLVLRILGAEDLAKDALQETFIKAWRRMHTYDPSKGKLLNWLLFIARNAAIDLLRSEQSRDHAHQASGEAAKQAVPPTRSGGSGKLDAAMDIGESLTHLNPQQAEVIRMLYFQGFTHVDAAKELGIPLGTLKSRLRLGMKNLKKRLTYD